MFQDPTTFPFLLSRILKSRLGEQILIFYIKIVFDQNSVHDTRAAVQRTQIWGVFSSELSEIGKFGDKSPEGNY